MPTALTESFCERCGTRYEFAAPSRLTPIRRTRGVISGLKNYILSQDSLSDSIGDAMRSHQDLLASKQLDAFHSSFKFCMDCRQYTCTSCWNEEAGRCQSCQPLPHAEELAQQFAATVGDGQSDVGVPFGLGNGSQGARPADPSWPATDLTEPPPVPLLSHTEPEPAVAKVEPEPEPVYAVPEPEPIVAEVEPEPEPAVAEVELEPEPVFAEVELEPEPVVAEVEPEQPVFAAPEPEPVLAEVEPEPEPMVAEVEPEPEPVLAEVEPPPFSAEAEPAVAEAEAGAQPDVAEADSDPEPEPEPYQPLRPIGDSFLHFPQAIPDRRETEHAAAAAADGETLAARRAQLNELGLGDPGQGPVRPARPVTLPYQSSGAVPREAERPAEVASGSTAGGAFWDASAREVSGAISQIGVRSCGHCELSLSATARFCRRCGTPQSQSA